MKSIKIVVIGMLLHCFCVTLSPNPSYEQTYNQLLTALQTDPHNPDLLLSLGFVLKKMNRFSQAIALYEHARPFVGQKSRLERGLSSAYLSLGDLERGWPAYEYRWVTPPEYNQELQRYIMHGGSLRNTIIVVKTEYGLGDTLQFIRYAQLLKDQGARVILECQKQLIPLLSLCPYIDEIHPQGTTIPAHFFVLLMSLPLIMNTNLASIPAQVPYLYADPKLIDAWKTRKIPSKKLHVGICWQADTHASSNNATVITDAQEKSIGLAQLMQIATESVQLYSLQKINGLEQLAAFSDNSLVVFDDLDTHHGAFMDTAAFMKQLDLVITIDTSIAHLAGGLGVPCWLLLPAAADWRWLSGVKEYEFTTPWYPNMRLLRQKTLGDWQPVIQEVIIALKEMA